MGSSFWTTPASGALIAIIGVVITAFFSFYLNERKRSWQLKDEYRLRSIARGEELYILLKKWLGATNAGFIYYPKVMLGEMHYNDVLDAVNEASEKHPIEIEKMLFLINIFFPAVKDDFDKIQKLIFEASSIEANYKKEYKLSGPYHSPSHAELYQQKIIEAEKQLNLLLQKLSSILKTIDNS